MNKKFLSQSIIAISLSLTIGAAESALIDRGRDSLGFKLIYDDVLDVTWYDLTYDEYDFTDTTNIQWPLNRWGDVVQWADLLTVNFGGTEYSDWRLTTADDMGYSSTPMTYDGSSAYGYNVTSSELGHLFHVSLGNLGNYDSSGSTIPGSGLLNTGPFENLRESMYYSETDTPQAYFPWTFDFDSGYQYMRDGTDGAFGLAVRDGDVAVSEPSILAILSAGLIGLGFARRRIHKG